MFKVTFAGLILLAITGCASAGPDKNLAEEKEYVTGSNIPKRDRASSGVIVVDPSAIENMRNSGTATAIPSKGGN
jgi:hypothetical protein